MKNSKKVFVIMMVLVISILALCLSACDRNINHYDIKIEDGTTPTEIVAKKALPSCVIVEYSMEGKLICSTIGFFVSNSGDIMTSATTTPKDLENIDIMATYYDNGRPITKVVEYDESKQIGGIYRDLALTLLKINDKNVKTTPIEFVDRELDYGESLLGVSSSVLSSSNFRVHSVMYGNSTMQYPTKDDNINMHSILKRSVLDGFIPCGDTLYNSSFTTSGLHNIDYLTMKSESFHYYKYYLDGRDNSSQIKLNASTSVLFDKEGKFVGFNYARVVDMTSSNINVVMGLGYAVKASVIDEALESVGL